MHSIKTKITLTTVCAMVIAMVIAGAFGVSAIRDMGRRDAQQLLQLLCQTGQKNLDHYFSGVEQSVEMVSAYVSSDLAGVEKLDEENLQAHLDRVSDMFKKLTKTDGVLTYYYRIDPELSPRVEGFWFVNLDGSDFVAHPVTDITFYNTEDTSSLVWFTVPRATGCPVWLPPYLTETLARRVISYNVPVYHDGRFVGVIGIELDSAAMVAEVDNISLYENGCAFVTDEEGNLVYHPRINMTLQENTPQTPEGLVSQESSVSYRFGGVDKQAAWQPLQNGMRLYVSVPVKEINADWLNWSEKIILNFSLLLLAFVVLILAFAGSITDPLRKLTEAAEQIDAGNYDFQLENQSLDEVGTLTRTFNRLTANLKTTIHDLNDLAFADPLTSLHNKGAFDILINKLDEQLQEPGAGMEFAVCIFDCNNLKQINDQLGHDKGDLYLKSSASLICHVFEHSPVFRIGGDEFAALLQGQDYQSREALLSLFDQLCAKARTQEDEPWEQVSVARGLAVYNPEEDGSVSDVVRRADKNMYENKWLSKEKQAREGR